MISILKQKIFKLKLLLFINFVSICLKAFSLKNTIKILDKLVHTKSIKNTPENPVIFLKRFVPLINHLSKYTFLRCMCLETSLIIRYFAKRNNIECELKLGTNITDKKFIAHAWIEVDGNVVSELEDQRDKYVQFNNSIDKLVF